MLREQACRVDDTHLGAAEPSRQVDEKHRAHAVPATHAWRHSA